MFSDMLHLQTGTERSSKKRIGETTPARMGESKDTRIRGTKDERAKQCIKT